MSIDIKSMLIGRTQGKKAGGSAVLTELTVTENGVYDKPSIGLEPIIWDGTYDGGFMLEETPGTGYIKVSDIVPSMDDLAYATCTVSTGESFSLNGDISELEEGPGVIMMNGGAVWVVSDPSLIAEYGIEFPAPGTYMFYAPEMTGYIASITFPSTPADGWNKVTVNVAGGIVDVPELPTVNIDETKIYRVASGDVVTYCIPNNATVRRLVDGAWVELI